MASHVERGELAGCAAVPGAATVHRDFWKVVYEGIDT